jgi:RNA polymerase sigma-70 factor (ECF subfamily)
VEEIAGAFLVSVSAMARRITRAKTRIREQRITYEIPTLEDLPRRIPGVLDVLYLIFNEGYLASGAADAEGAEHHGLLRPDLMAEAVRLARLVHHLVREDGEATGLLALMLLIEARSPARTSADGSLVPLDRQDRSLWDPSMIAEGHRLIRERLGSGEVPGRFQFIAAINAVHTSAASFEQTDWPQVLALYDQLSACDPSPVVALNRAIAVAEVEGPQVALDLTDQFAERLAAYHAHHATRADLLRRLGRDEEAREAYTRAIDCAGNPAEIAELTRRRAEVQR